jgi:hypothetical protein
VTASIKLVQSADSQHRYGRLDVALLT